MGDLFSDFSGILNIENTSLLSSQSLNKGLLYLISSAINISEGLFNSNSIEDFLYGNGNLNVVYPRNYVGISANFQI